MKVAFFDAKQYDIDSFNACLSGRNDIEITYFETKLDEKTVSLTMGYEAICVFVNDNLNKEVIDKLYENGVKLITLRCAGFDKVDLSACFGRIHVLRVPAYSPYAVAEFAMALLLTSNRRIHKSYMRTREYNFALNGLTGVDLYGKTIGVIGTGKIGQKFINICKGFGMNVICYDKFPNEALGYNYVDLDTLFRNSDFISLHCPLTQETKHIINKDSIAKMKNGVMIINTSRGQLIDTEALLNGILDRKVGSACLDVYEEEADLFFSDKSNHIMNDKILRELLSMPNVIVTSHQAFLTSDALANIADTTINNIKTFFDGTYNAENEVCYHCPNMANCKKKRKDRCF
ncbi:MAG: 2-hydroxyacid dehydrogenase [Bacilli bacterium]|nr:2-hydroxyacid dehydrogenase [Bacilli bacterium]